MAVSSEESTRKRVVDVIAADLPTGAGLMSAVVWWPGCFVAGAETNEWHRVTVVEWPGGLTCAEDGVPNPSEEARRVIRLVLSGYVARMDCLA